MVQGPSGRSGDIIPSGYKTGQLQQFDPKQMRLYKQGFNQLKPGSYLSRLAGGDEEMFAEMEAPAMRQFQEMLGGLGSRFSGASRGVPGQGSLGTRRSSGFQNTGTAAVSNFAQDLAANRQNLQRQALNDMMNYSQMLMGQRPYERTLMQKPEKEPSGWGSLLGGVAGGVGGAFFGQPVLGAQLGSTLGGMF